MPRLRYSRQIKGKRQTVVTGSELLSSFTNIGKVASKPKMSDQFLTDFTDSIGIFLSTIGDFLQCRWRQDVIDWENRKVEIDTETADEKRERWRCKSFDFMDPYLERIEEKKKAFRFWGN